MSKVKIKNVKNNMVMSYTLVSDSEANLRENKIAVSTPIAKGLMGKKVGDVVEIKVPSGGNSLPQSSGRRRFFCLPGH